MEDKSWETEFITEDPPIVENSWEDEFTGEEIKVTDNQGYDDRALTNEKEFEKAKEEFASQNEINDYFKSPEVQDSFKVPAVTAPPEVNVKDVKKQLEDWSLVTYDYKRFNTITKTVWLEAPFNDKAVPKYMKLISDFGYGDNFTAALLGNAAVENGGSFAATQEERGKPKSKGKGIWQYTKGTQKAYDKWLSENKDVTDGGWAQVKFMHKLLTGEIKNPKTGGAFLGDGHLKEFKKLTDNPNTTVSQYNDWILKIPMNPLNPDETRDRRLLYANLFLEDLRRRYTK